MLPLLENQCRSKYISLMVVSEEEENVFFLCSDFD